MLAWYLSPAVHQLMTSLYREEKDRRSECPDVIDDLPDIIRAEVAIQGTDVSWWCARYTKLAFIKEHATQLFDLLRGAACFVQVGSSLAISSFVVSPRGLRALFIFRAFSMFWPNGPECLGAFNTIIPLPSAPVCTYTKHAGIMLAANLAFIFLDCHPSPMHRFVVTSRVPLN